MKTKILFLFAAASAAAVAPVFAADSNKKATSAQVEVKFENPDDFRDIKDAQVATEKGKEANLSLFRSYLEEQAPRYLQPGQKLTVTFTDIDMAGDFEPWHGVAAQDVRIVKSIYIPRMELNYKLTGADGTVIKEGSEKLTDMNFQMNITGANNSDPLRYEKRMLDDWLRSELRTAKK